MTHSRVNIDGKEFPISFGMNALAQFTRQAGLSLKQLGSLDEHLDLQNTLLLVWCGMNDGHRKARRVGEEKGQFTLTIEDVGDLLDSDPDALNNVMNVFNESMPTGGNGKTQAARKKK